MVPKDQEPVEDQQVSVEESAEGEEPKPRRRSRAVLRGARIKRRGGKLRAVMALILVLAVGAGTWITVSRYFRTNPRYTLTAIELRGQKHLGQSEVEAVFKPDEGHSIYSIPIDERRRQIEEISWVHHASVTRVLPGQIWVRVEEREPVAFLWGRKGASLIDGDGVVLDTPPETYFNLPVVRGVSQTEPAESRHGKLQRLVSFLGAIKSADAHAVDQVSEVNLSDPRNLRAIITEGDHSVLLHFGEELFSERFLTYQAHIDEWRRQFAEMQSIDLRYEGQAVIHSSGSQAVRVDSPAAKTTHTVQPLKTPPPASRAAAQPAVAPPPAATPPEADDDDLPNPPLQQAGMVPDLIR